VIKSKLCRFSVLRYVPNENREEFINVGLLFHSPEDGYVNLKITKNFTRVTAFDDEMDISFLKTVLEGVQQEFMQSTIEGPSPIETSKWDFIKRNTSIFVNQLQFSKVRTIRSVDIYQDEESLFKTYVYFDVKKNKRITEDEVRSIMNRVFKDNKIFTSLERNINVDLGTEQIQIDYLYDVKNQRKTKIVKTLSFDYSSKQSSRSTQLAKEWVWNYAKLTELTSNKKVKIKNIDTPSAIDFTTLVYYKEYNKNVKAALQILSEASNTVEAKSEENIKKFASDLIDDVQVSSSDLIKA
jgi:hypothetical protein